MEQGSIRRHVPAPVKARARRAINSLRGSAQPASVGALRAHQPPAGPRLVPSPVFVLSHMRSGSTLARAVLNSHPDICAPPEMHLGLLAVRPRTDHARLATAQLGYTTETLANMLWDRVLYDQLIASGKSVIVDKTPQNTLRLQRIMSYWPEARLIVLRRHPVRIVESIRSWRGGKVRNPRLFATITRYARELNLAEQAHGGFSLRYEDLTRRPEAVTSDLCTFVGVPWTPKMLEYGERDHGGFKRGLGDSSEKIRSGKIQPAPPDPVGDEIPEGLREACELMGYSL
jgi:hypothetical protein